MHDKKRLPLEKPFFVWFLFFPMQNYPFQWASFDTKVPNLQFSNFLCKMCFSISNASSIWYRFSKISIFLNIRWWVALSSMSFIVSYVNWDREGTAKIGYYVPFFGARMHHHEPKCAHMHALDYHLFELISASQIRF